MDDEDRDIVQPDEYKSLLNQASRAVLTSPDLEGVTMAIVILYMLVPELPENVSKEDWTFFNYDVYNKCEELLQTMPLDSEERDFYQRDIDQLRAKLASTFAEDDSES